MRRVLARVDPDALDLVIGRWLTDQQSPQPRPWRQAVAVDGKTLRGSGHHPSPDVHLLAVMEHTRRAVLAQTDVDIKTNEIARFQPLLEGLNRVWVANGQDGTISRIDPETNQVGTIHLGYRPTAVAVEQGAIWVALAP